MADTQREENLHKYGDRPIVKSEKDKFGFQGYAEVLARRIHKAEPPLTLGIFGSWGSGKTSLMRLLDIQVSGEDKKENFIRRWLGYFRRKKDTIETLWVNIWELSSQEEVWKAFLQALFSKVNKKLAPWQKIEWRKLFKQLIANSYRIILVITPIIVGGFMNKEDATWEDVFTWDLLNPFYGSASDISGAWLSYGLALWTIVKPAIEKASEVTNFDLKAVLKLGS